VPARIEAHDAIARRGAPHLRAPVPRAPAEPCMRRTTGPSPSTSSAGRGRTSTTRLLRLRGELRERRVHGREHVLRSLSL
jgi:hypothetical protein